MVSLVFRIQISVEQGKNKSPVFTVKSRPETYRFEGIRSTENRPPETYFFPQQKQCVTGRVFGVF